MLTLHAVPLMVLCHAYLAVLGWGYRTNLMLICLLSLLT